MLKKFLLHEDSNDHCTDADYHSDKHVVHVVVECSADFSHILILTRPTCPHFIYDRIDFFRKCIYLCHHDSYLLFQIRDALVKILVFFFAMTIASD